jgi:hypothetical protein
MLYFFSIGISLHGKNVSVGRGATLAREGGEGVSGPCGCVPACSASSVKPPPRPGPAPGHAAREADRPSLLGSKRTRVRHSGVRIDSLPAGRGGSAPLTGGTRPAGRLSTAAGSGGLLATYEKPTRHNSFNSNIILLCLAFHLLFLRTYFYAPLALAMTLPPVEDWEVLNPSHPPPFNN